MSAELEDQNEHTFLVAFSVYGETREEAELALHGELLEHPVSATDSPIESWWVAEDDRRDGSDRDSAVFVAKGGQANASRLMEREMASASWNITPQLRCRTCGAQLHRASEKAVGSGEVQLVWADLAGAWVCPATGQEHELAGVER